MSESARAKTYDSIYHIMLQSISDVILFKNTADMDMYLATIKKYQDIFQLKVYAYCLIDTYIHLLLYCNGADISKVMHNINQSYVQNYNNTHKRHGPLFDGRFKSKIITEFDSLINTSAYIHKFPRTIKNYKGIELEYKYSSYGAYLGSTVDESGILDTSFILNMFIDDEIPAKELYHQFVIHYDEKSQSNDNEFKNERSEHISEKHALIRNITPDKVIKFMEDYTNIDNLYIRIDPIKDTMEIKCLSVFLMRCFCDISQRDISAALGNMSPTNVSRLCRKAVKLIDEKPEFKNIINDFLRANNFNSSLLDNL